MTETNTIESVSAPHDDYQPLVRLWILRILAGTEAQHRCLRKATDSGDLLAFLGYTPSGKQKKEEEWAGWLAAEQAVAEKAGTPHDGVLFQNISKIAEMIGLSGVEQEVLAFRALSRGNEALQDLMHIGFWNFTDARLVRVLATALGRNRHELEEAIRPEGGLFASRLMRLDPAVTGFHIKISCISGLINALMRRNGSPDDLIRFAVSRSPETRITREDCPHLAQELDLLIDYLGTVKARGLAGVNILLYGAPGVGKTELARVVARELGMRLYEVSMANRDGGALQARERFDAYCLNQHVFARDRDVLVVFDEIEDVFPRPTFFHDPEKPVGRDKAWVNRLLETNSVPTFWVANRIDQIDPAYLRRFDHVIEMRIPPRSVRYRIARRYFEGLPVDEARLARLTEIEGVSPALIEKASKVMRHLGHQTGEDIEQHLERLIEGALEVQGIPAKARYPQPANYRIDCLNTSIDIRMLPTTLRSVGKGRILLHGAPGTGKTAFGHYLARELDRPLMLRRASDIQSMWVGEAEKNIARMFREAAEDQAVLLLDEADSFLQDRRQAIRSWEVSQVNELLTQMECFEGVFLCATNFIDHLDTASIRRFGLKVRFDCLTAEQRYAMFEELLNELGATPADELVRAKARRILVALSNLTPGDFAAVRQRIELLGKPVDAVALADALREESELKPDGKKRAIGFAG